VLQAFAQRTQARRRKPGAGCGALGYLWSKRHSRLAGLAVAGTFVVEPLVYLTRAETLLFRGPGYALAPQNLTIWAIEVTVGIGAAAWVASSRRRMRPAPGTARKCRAPWPVRP
jgi:hypothetical protein